MSENVRRFACPPEAVFAVLADGWLYPSWVVGATRMRAVDAAWPEPGARLHHSVGVWPLVIDDVTVSEECVPLRRARMRAKGWPIGEAEVLLEVRPARDGCLVRISEQPAKGPGRLVPNIVVEPLLRLRNAETLRRLAHLAEGRARGTGHDGSVDSGRPPAAADDAPRA